MSGHPEEEPTPAMKLLSTMVNAGPSAKAMVQLLLLGVEDIALARELILESISFIWEKDEAAKANERTYFEMGAELRRLRGQAPNAEIKRDETTETREFTCVQAWPECSSGEYNPRCCRFPKSCSVDEVAPYRVRWDEYGEPSLAEPRPIETSATVGDPDCERCGGAGKVERPARGHYNARSVVCSCVAQQRLHKWDRSEGDTNCLCPHGVDHVESPLELSELREAKAIERGLLPPNRPQDWEPGPRAILFDAERVIRRKQRYV